MSRQKEIYQELQSLSDPKYKEFHGGLVPGEENLLGVRIPALRGMPESFLQSPAGARISFCRRSAIPAMKKSRCRA